jgi:hypothetical protein
MVRYSTTLLLVSGNPEPIINDESRRCAARGGICLHKVHRIWWVCGVHGVFSKLVFASLGPVNGGVLDLRLDWALRNVLALDKELGATIISSCQRVK